MKRNVLVAAMVVAMTTLQVQAQTTSSSGSPTQQKLGASGSGQTSGSVGLNPGSGEQNPRSGGKVPGARGQTTGTSGRQGAGTQFTQPDGELTVGTRAQTNSTATGTTGQQSREQRSKAASGTGSGADKKSKSAQKSGGSSSRPDSER